jgi:hypothetical protein
MKDIEQELGPSLEDALIQKRSKQTIQSEGDGSPISTLGPPVEHVTASPRHDARIDADALFGLDRLMVADHVRDGL